MASGGEATFTPPIASATLLEQLAILLPSGTNFRIYHISTPPTRTTALYAAPFGRKPERTYCESHFLTVSIQAKENGQDVLVYAIEILIYSTASSSTFFVSKADSTGFLHLLNLPKGAPSPLRDISSTFLKHLLKQRRRRNVRSIVSLFARAQDQYLFPGSIEYHGKHVLDDRGLIRWWCKVLNPLIEDTKTSFQDKDSPWKTIEGFLIVPGLDSHETESYIPKASKSCWTMGHPLQQISGYGGEVPPRCIIPHFPDDPKARYLDELDEETNKSQNSSNGRWKSVKTVDQFWDMMAFRQECSAGRLVGFIWVVLTPLSLDTSVQAITDDSQSTMVGMDGLSEPSQTASLADCPDLSFSSATSIPSWSQSQPMSPPSTQNSIDRQSAARSSTRQLKRPKLIGPIVAREPRVKTHHRKQPRDQLEDTPYYTWGPLGRGQVVLEEPDYKRITELLLRLDFANLDLASSSSQRWIDEVRSGATIAASNGWGQPVAGQKVFEPLGANSTTGVNTLSIGLVRKKRKTAAGEPEAPVSITKTESPAINVLSGGMIRKKTKA